MDLLWADPPFFQLDALVDTVALGRDHAARGRFFPNTTRMFFLEWTDEATGQEIEASVYRSGLVNMKGWVCTGDDRARIEAFYDTYLAPYVMQRGVWSV